MRRSWLPILFTALAACAADSDGASVGTPLTPLGDAGAGAPVTPDAGTSTVQNPAVTTDAGTAIISYSDSGAAGNGENCVATKAVAPPASNPKIDIVWVVDTSGSMFGEQKLIKDNLAAFADSISKANLDLNIIMVSESPTLIPIGFQFGICPELPPDPLTGSPLQMDPRYHFVRTRVDSPEPLTVAVQRYPEYSKFLRPDSSVHYIFVTDDDARYAGGDAAGRARQFQMDMTQRLGRPFRAHIIASPVGQRCSNPNCMPDPNMLICALVDATCTAAGGGDTYYSLAPLTQGLSASICEADWTKIFAAFQENIIKSAPLPCDYAIPPPPKGDTLNPSKVNVGYTPPGGSEELLRKVADANACGTSAGWYYDQGVTKVLLCPTACTKASQGGSMNIAFGCNTIVLE